MKNLILRKEKKNFTMKLDKNKMQEVLGKLNTLYISYSKVEQSIEDLDHFELLEEYAEELGITSEVEEINHYFNDFDYFFKVYYEGDPQGAANAVHFGNYNPLDNYITFDGYGNIKTLDETERENEIESLYNTHRSQIIREAIKDGKTDEAEQWNNLLNYRSQLIKPYRKHREEKQNKVNKTPYGFAFSDKQFNEMMEKWGLDPEKDLSKIVSIGAGGFIQKKDIKAMENTNAAIYEKEKMLSYNPYFLAGALFEEMANHELIYNYDIVFDLENTFTFSKKFWQKIADFFEEIQKIEYSIECQYC